MRENQISPKGVVLNPYFLNQPLYEAFYGYRAFCYWQYNPQASENLFPLLKEEKPREIWVNILAQNDNLAETLKDSGQISQLDYYIERNSRDNSSSELADWIERHRPEYPTELRYLSVIDLIEIGITLGIRIQVF